MMNLFQILALPTVNLDQCGGLGPIVRFIKFGIMPIIQFGIPIILIVMGSIDLGKAVMSQDDKEIKGATGKLIKRVIYAIVVFFIPFIVNLAMKLVGTAGVTESDSQDGFVTCWNNISKK